MSKKFHTYVHQVVDNIDGNQAEKEDLYEELIIHLQLSYDQFIEEGYGEEKAEQLALENFGDSNDIGNQIQEAMYPYRKMMFLTLAIASLLYSFIIYAIQLFSEGDAHIIWLLFSVITSSILLLIAIQSDGFLNRKRRINITLFCHIFIYLYSYFLASSIPIFIPFSFISVFILILSVVLVYRTTIYDYPTDLIKGEKQIKLLHFLNLTFGFIIISATLFFIWALLVFSETFEFIMLGLLIPVAIWMIAYFTQIQLVAKGKKKTAYIITVIPFILTFIILLWFSVDFI